MYFSVIVPVYNVAPYLKTCVDSILSQTYPAFELILVDDGSLDACPAMCDTYAAADRRVKVIHQKNSGPAHARKSGLRAATGRYVVFVDGDDWIAPGFLERGRTLLEETQAELILFARSFVYGTRMEVVHEPVAEGLYERERILSELYPCMLMNSQMKHLFYFTSGKIFRRSLAEKGCLSVNEKISLGEDLLSVLPVYLEAQCVYVSYESADFYRIKAQSACHGFQVKQYGQILLVLKELKKICRERKKCLPEDFERQMERYGAYMCFTLLVHAVNDREFRQWKIIRRRMRHPLLQECVREARFVQISPKTRITYWLLRRNWILLSYLFLCICRNIRMYVPKKIK